MQKSHELLCVCGRSFGRAQHGTGSDARLIRGDFPEGVLGVSVKRNSEDVALQPGFSWAEYTLGSLSKCQVLGVRR